MPQRIGFIGLGRMGLPMARRLLEAGYTLALFDIRPESAQPLVAMGAHQGATPHEAADGADVVVTMVPDSNAVEAAVLGPGGAVNGLRPGAVLVDMSSSYPLRTRELARKVEVTGAVMLDAPVSGGVIGAENGTLSIMVGGDYPTFDRLKPFFAVLGKNVVHMGAVGAGHATKAINNFLSGTTLLATCEAMVIAVKAGLDPERVNGVIQTSTGRSYSTEHKMPRFILPRTFNSGFGMSLLHKDLSMLVRLGQDLGAPTFLSSLVQQFYALALSEVGPTADHTEIAKLLEDWAGVTVSVRAEES